MEATKQLTKHIEAAKAEAISLAKNLAGVLGELKKYGLHFHVTNDKEFKALAVSFGTPDGNAPTAKNIPKWAPIKPKAGKGKGKGKAKGKRGAQGEAIIAAIGSKELPTGEIGAAIGYKGANLSAVLSGMAKAGKLVKNDKDKKWSVKK